MTRLNSIILAGLSVGLVFMASCSEENPWGGPESQGGVNLAFSTDSRVMRNTRADDNVSPVVPGNDSFNVTFTKSDGSYSKTWRGVESFNRESYFPIGDYTLAVTSGNIEEEGFSSPCFKGTADVHVSPGVETPVKVVATLANAMVSVRYTKEFTDNFPQYSAAVQTSGHDWIVFAQTEDRPAYVAPGGEVALKLTMTDASGQQVTIQPASFEAQPRRHYVVTIGVTGNVASGDLALDIEFDEDVVADTVSVSLGDELFSAQPPSLKPIGFTPGTALTGFEGSTAPGTEFHAFAFGGLKSARLTVISSDYTPSFGGTVELVNAPSLTQTQLATEGIVCSGFFNNPDKMGVVDLSRFIGAVPAGSYKVRMEVADAMTRLSEPLEIEVVRTPVVLEFGESPAIPFMSSEAIIKVETNNPDIAGQLKFKLPDASNRMVDSEPVNVSTTSSATVQGATHTLTFTLPLQPQVRTTVDVIMTLGRKQRQTGVSMVIPEITLIPDAYSRRVQIKVETSGAEASGIADNLVFYNGASQIPSSNVRHLGAGDIVEIQGLTPDSHYPSLSAKLGTVAFAVPAFDTEQETGVPNGNFASVFETVNIFPIQVGGMYKVGAYDYYNRTTLKRSEALGWASLNQKTCYTGSSPMNTWFAVPQVFVESGAAVIRSVGYNHSGTVPAKTGSFFSATYYNTSAPAESQFVKEAGEMFLGSYSYNGAETRTDGVVFGSRPCLVSFRYKYEPIASEKGEALVEITDEAGNVLASAHKVLDAANAFTTVEMPLSGYPFAVKAAAIKVSFRSVQKGVTPSLKIPSGSELMEPGVSLNFDFYYTLSPNNYHALATGSVLTVDDVSVSYATPMATSPKRVKNKK